MVHTARRIAHGARHRLVLTDAGENGTEALEGRVDNGTRTQAGLQAAQEVSEVLRPGVEHAFRDGEDLCWSLKLRR